MTKSVLVAVTTILAACASSSGVVPTGADTYMVSRSEKKLDTTGSRVKAEALREASEFCAKSGKSIEIIKATEKDMVPFRSDPQAEVQFRCK